MSSEALYERYKAALKRGHVASLRGRLDEALDAYREAASIAPERATPHTSAGNALLRHQRPADAVAHYGVALQLAPRDEAALLGRAQALAALGRPHEAADVFDTLAEVRSVAGRPADAVEAARQGLELAEGRDRRRALERLVGELREAELDEPGRDALDRALQVLRGSAVAAATGEAGLGLPPAAQGAATEPGPAEADVIAAPVPFRAALDRDLPADLDLPALVTAAEVASVAGRRQEALGMLLDAAAAYRRDGRTDAALDVCYQGLSLVPDDVELHLALVELYEDRGLAPLATEKLTLLERLVGLDGDEAATARVAEARAAAH